jgi:hypothetical protein
VAEEDEEDDELCWFVLKNLGECVVVFGSSCWAIVTLLVEEVGRLL